MSLGVVRPGATKATDVARAAGVSVATVSLVVNGKAAGRVSPATQRKVERVIQELGYEVNSAARSLATGRRHCIALVASDVSNPFISTIAAGVASVLGDEYQLLLAISGSERALPDVRRVLAFGVDGVLLDLPLATEVRERAPEIPLVSLDDPSAPADVSRVSFGMQQATGELADHLASMGHRNVLYLDAARPWATFKARRDVFVRAARRLHVAATTVRSDIEIGATRDVVLRQWGQWSKSGITAVVAASDVQAFGVLEALQELGVDVPGQVSLASFDGLPYAAITDPPLTTVSLPAFDLGAHGARLMLQLVEGPARAITAVELPATLQLRQSTGAAASVKSGKRVAGRRSAQ